MSENQASEPGGFPKLLLLLASAAFLILCGLGTWQVQRLRWKEDLIARIDERTRQAPVALASIMQSLASGEDIDYVPVRVTGTFRHDLEQFFFATHRGASGFFVYTPLTLEQGSLVFVNRGFVPFDRKDAAGRADGQVSGAVTIVGLARSRLTGKPSFVIPDNDPAKNVFYWKDLDAMAGNAGLDPGTVVPLFIDAGDAPNPGGLPVGGVTLIDLPNNHLQYAITWFGLAAALAGVTAVYLARRRLPSS
jgi:surfeit locus 1 family protein